jgi:trans-2,3-dihydro-3-hydroxyanthranilate isomerase
MSLSYLHYDVFTDEPLAGNQLAVFLDAQGVTPPRMQALAREMNFAESTFILPAEVDGTDVRMRIFTPMREMPMAGHPTIGSTFALAHTGTIRPGSPSFVFGLGVGPIPVDLEWDGSRLRFAWMTQLNPTFAPPIEARGAIAAAIGLTEGDLVAGLPVQHVSCGVPFLLVPVRSREAVDRAVSDASAFRRLRETTGLDRPIFFFSTEQGAPEASAYSRMFAPEFGIVEDPATGSACGPLGCYLVTHRVVSRDAAARLVALQGVAMGRPSRIHISITSGADGQISQVKVGGQAILIAEGELRVS